MTRASIPERAFDARSFRTKRVGDHLITIGCPKGQWDARRKRCRAGTRAQRILHPVSENNPLTIPGHVREIWYERTGRYPGPYRHSFGPNSQVRMIVNPDGSVTLRGRRRVWGAWEMKPKRKQNPERKGGGFLLYLVLGILGYMILTQPAAIPPEWT